MLDYCIKEGFVTLGEDDKVERTDKCPSWLEFKETKDGIILFYTQVGNTQIFIDDKYIFEDIQNHLKNQIK